jgi:hypothetical protein
MISKLKTKLQTSAEDKQRLKRSFSTATSSLQAILQIAKEAAGSAGIPGLHAGISGLLVLLDVIGVCYYRAVLDTR